VGFTAITHNFYGSEATSSYFAIDKPPSSSNNLTLTLLPTTQFFYPFPAGPWDPANCDAANSVPPPVLAAPPAVRKGLALLTSDEFIWYDCDLTSIEKLGFGAVIFVSPPEPTVTGSLTQGVGDTNHLSMPVFVMPLEPFLNTILPDIQVAVAEAGSGGPAFQQVTLSTAYGNPSGVCLGSAGARAFQIVMTLDFLLCMVMTVTLLAADKKYGWQHFDYVGQGLVVSSKLAIECAINPGWSFPWAWKLFLPFRFSTEPIEFSTNLVSAWMYGMIAASPSPKAKKIGHVVVACAILAYYAAVYTFYGEFVATATTVPLESSDGFSGKINTMVNAYYYSNVGCTSIYCLILGYCVWKVRAVADRVAARKPERHSSKSSIVGRGNAKGTQLRKKLCTIVAFNSVQILGALLLMCHQLSWEATHNKQDFNVAGRPEWHGFHCVNFYFIFLGSGIASTAQIGFFFYNKVMLKKLEESRRERTHGPSIVCCDSSTDTEGSASNSAGSATAEASMSNSATSRRTSLSSMFSRPSRGSKHRTSTSISEESESVGGGAGATDQSGKQSKVRSSANSVSEEAPPATSSV